MWLVHWPAPDHSAEFSLDYASIGDIFSNNYTCFFGNCNDYDWLTGNSTSCRLLRSVIILVIDKYLLITSELGGKRTQVSVAPPPPQEEWKEG